MADLSKNAAFDDVDALLNATMEDIEGLAPLAIPPTGNYTLRVRIERKEINEKDALMTSYEVVEIGEVDDPEEAAEVKVGQQFQNGLFVKTKEGKVNQTGIGAFKTSLEPFAAHFYPEAPEKAGIADLIEKTQEGLLINATVKRTQRKGGADDEYNFRLKNVIVL